MLQTSKLASINLLTKPSGGFVVIFAVIGDGTGSFQSVNLIYISQKKRNYLYPKIIVYNFM